MSVEFAKCEFVETDMGDAEVRLSDRTLAEVRSRAVAGCFMCKWVLESLAEGNSLRDWPPDAEGEPRFPVRAQRYHVLKETGR